MATINLNSTEEKYEELSNNYRSKLVIDSTIYPSVTNYIYSKLMTDIVYKEKLLKANPDIVYKIFIENMTEKYNKISSESYTLTYQKLLKRREGKKEGGREK